MACECGVGAESAICDGHSGQCVCKGDATGRRCDRCDSPTTTGGGRRAHRQLDRRTLRCESTDRCPSQVDERVEWPSTLRGVVARESCPDGQLGIATRRCDVDGQWEVAHTFNCTLSALVDLRHDFSSIDRVARQTLAITTAAYTSIRGASMDLVLEIVDRLMAEPTASREHARHGDYTHIVLGIVDQLLEQRLALPQRRSLLVALHSYGRRLLDTHINAPHLRPFRFSGHAIGQSTRQSSHHTFDLQILSSVELFDRRLSFSHSAATIVVF